MEVALIAKQVLYFLLLFISLTLHEWAHAWVADRLGDPQPRADGRVSLNPFVHIDFMGTILFPLICIGLSTGILFGWGKPVLFNSHYFKKPRCGELFAGSAGLLGNLMICFICSLILGFLPTYYTLAYAMLTLNAFLIAFNCLPIPTLDGFFLFKYFFDFSSEVTEFLERWGFIILLILINVPVCRYCITCLIHWILTFFLQLSIKLQTCIH